MRPGRLRRNLLRAVGGKRVWQTAIENTKRGCCKHFEEWKKPQLFNGTEGVVGLRRWIEKVEQVFEICKCAEEDKVMFAASTFEGRALTWWNGNQTKSKRWTRNLDSRTMKRRTIEAYSNRFHELVLMCPELVPTEKKIKKYVRGFLEIIKGNITSLKPETLHDALHGAPLNWRCQRTGHQEKDCRARVPGAGVTPFDVTCYGCGEKGHYKDKCPKGRNQQNEGARGRAYVSFVSSAFTPFIDIAPTTLNTSYEVELADGKVILEFRRGGQKRMGDHLRVSWYEMKLDDTGLSKTSLRFFLDDLSGLPADVLVCRVN
ncbi:putative reverse transcriptase domain-containing protein [Tanacetum coccineum]